jgi:hypothetical protein
MEAFGTDFVEGIRPFYTYPHCIIPNNLNHLPIVPDLIVPLSERNRCKNNAARNYKHRLREIMDIVFIQKIQAFVLSTIPV